MKREEERTRDNGCDKRGKKGNKKGKEVQREDERSEVESGERKEGG